MTNKEVFDRIRKIGMAVSYNQGEWCINYKRTDDRRTVESSYYTNDKDDALQTAAVMFLWNPSIK